MKKAATAKKPRKAAAVEVAEGTAELAAVVKKKAAAKAPKAKAGKKTDAPKLQVIENTPETGVPAVAAAEPTSAPAPAQPAVKASAPTANAAPTTATIGAPSSPQKRAEVEQMLSGMLQHMKYPAKLELKDLTDGSLGVAVHFSGDLPGITPGKRSYLVDCMQFLVNKSVNKPNTTERRWVTLGVDAFPEPRPPQQQRQQQQGQQQQAKPSQPQGKPSQPNQQQQAPQQPQRGQQNNGRPAQPPPQQQAQQQRPQQHSREPDESKLTPSPDPLMSQLGTMLAQKATKLGRVYAVMMLNADDRSRVLTAGRAVGGLTVKAEGEQHWRRVAFVPEKITPILRKQVMPDFDDEEEE